MHTIIPHQKLLLEKLALAKNVELLAVEGLQDNSWQKVATHQATTVKLSREIFDLALDISDKIDLLEKRASVAPHEKVAFSLADLGTRLLNNSIGHTSDTSSDLVVKLAAAGNIHQALSGALHSPGINSNLTSEMIKLNQDHVATLLRKCINY